MSRGPFDARLLSLVPAARAPLGVLTGLGVLGGALAVGIAVALTNVVVAVVVGTGLLPALGWLLGVMAARALISWLTEVLSARLAVTVTDGLRLQLTQSWLDRPADRPGEPAAAAAMAAQGVTAIEPYVTKYLPALLAAVITPVLALATLLWVDPLSALIVLLTLPLLPFFATLIGAATARESQRRWRTLTDLAGHFTDVMKGLPTLVNYGRAQRQVGVIEKVSKQHRKATMDTLRLAFMSSAALELLASLSVAIVAVTVGLRLTYGSMGLWAGLLAILLAPEAYWPIRRVGAEFHAAADGVEALDRIHEHLEQPRPEADTDASDQDANTALMALHEVTYQYPGAPSPVLHGVEAQWLPGLHVITGASGLGKTTLLEVMAGLRQVDEGVIAAGRVHLVAARPFLPAGSLQQTLSLGNDASAGEIWLALQDVDLHRWVHGLADGLATQFGDDGFGMSAGQRARVVLARAILSGAPVLLLDEPTAHLDAESAEQVHHVLRRLATRRCVIAVTHQPLLMALADSRVAMEALT